MKTRRPSKFKPEYYVTAYRLARAGASDRGMAKALGVRAETLARWAAKKPAFAEAVRRGREEGGSVESFKEFIHGRLTGRAREMWDELERAEKAFTEGGSADRLEEVLRMMADGGERVRQQLFVHALMASGFQPSVAARRTGVPMSVVKAWLKDRRFGAMIAQVHQCKKDFFEGALIELVRKGDSAAVIFVNKTVNRDRGYSEKSPEDATRRHEHVHRLILDDLPADVKRALLDSVRRKQLEYDGNITDVEVET